MTKENKVHKGCNRVELSQEGGGGRTRIITIRLHTNPEVPYAIISKICN
jgi:hypothetical protein